MPARFDSFVIFAEMRTGSNFLESNLNALSGLSCHGEAFNPHFIGYPDRADLLDIPQKKRDRRPDLLLDALAEAPGLNGFRYFHDHDPRILDRLLADARCAKIILTRDPLESYVSWKIARGTGQWKLTNVERRKEVKALFDPVEYADFVNAVSTFHHDISRRLQISGQVPFRLVYEDLKSLDVINGIAAFLGLSDRLADLDTGLKVQNPGALAEKVINPDDMAAVLSARDLENAPSFEPRRFANVQSYLAGTRVPLLYLPVPGGPTSGIKNWLAQLDGVAPGQLMQNMNRKTLRQWKATRPGHRSFTVLRHPLARAHHAFCRHIVGIGAETYGGMRKTLIRRYGVMLPDVATGSDYTPADHRRAFLQFLTFLKANLAGQTAIRVDASWGSQVQAIAGFGRFVAPDFVLREQPDLSRDLSYVAQSVAHQGVLAVAAEPDVPFALDSIYDAELEALAARAYQKDYTAFGFGPWRQAA